MKLHLNLRSHLQDSTTISFSAVELRDLCIADKLW